VAPLTNCQSESVSSPRPSGLRSPHQYIPKERIERSKAFLRMVTLRSWRSLCRSGFRVRAILQTLSASIRAQRLEDF
jgi:hypothetical protein